MSLYVKTIKFIDKFVVSIACIILGVFLKIYRFIFPPKCPKNPRNILIIKVWALGDTINFLPTIDSIKKKYPEAKIWALAKNRNKVVFESTNLIN